MEQNTSSRAESILKISVHQYLAQEMLIKKGEQEGELRKGES